MIVNAGRIYQSDENTDNRRQEGRKARGQVNVDWAFSPTAKNKIAFTLAETLITLVIVGVVAALTIPNLIVKYQKEQTVTRLKKTYSTLQQAVTKSISENGISEFDSFATWSNDDFEKYIAKYLSATKKGRLKPSDRYMLHGGVNWTTQFGWNPNEWILNDGTWISFFAWGGSNYIMIDINGGNKPNRLGRDTFYFYLKKDKIAPWGYGQSRNNLLGTGAYNCNKAAWNPGYSCAGVIMMDGWQIKDDYPW